MCVGAEKHLDGNHKLIIFIIIIMIPPNTFQNELSFSADVIYTHLSATSTKTDGKSLFPHTIRAPKTHISILTAFILSVSKAKCCCWAHVLK